MEYAFLVEKVIWIELTMGSNGGNLVNTLTGKKGLKTHPPERGNEVTGSTIHRPRLNLKMGV